MKQRHARGAGAGAGVGAGAGAGAAVGVGAAVIALAALTGCAPESTYRYTAFSPTARPVAWDGRTEPAGTVRLEGTLAASSVDENLAPRVGDTAMLVPQTTLEGSAVVALAPSVELGVRGSYASYAWAQQSAVGTQPVPGAPASWGIGPELRLAFPLDRQRHFALGFVGNIIDTQVPYAGWVLTGPQPAGGATSGSPLCTPSPTCVNGYTLGKQGTESDLVWSVGILPSYAFGEHGEYGHAFAGITATTGFKNVGFSDTQQSGSSVSTFWPLWVVSAGYAGSIQAVRLSAMLYKPLTDAGSAVNYGFGALFTVGVAIPAWDPRKADG